MKQFVQAVGVSVDQILARPLEGWMTTPWVGFDGRYILTDVFIF
jgi:hypothetical protein